MHKRDLEKYKFDQRMKLGLILILLVFAGFLAVVHSGQTGEVITLIIGLVGGNAMASKSG